MTDESQPRSFGIVGLPMRGRAAADPFEVRTMTSGGEEMAFSDPFVSDAQRAAAGRETVADG